MWLSLPETPAKESEVSVTLMVPKITHQGEISVSKEFLMLILCNK